MRCVLSRDFLRVILTNLQLGVALGFVIPVSIVANQKLEENIYMIGDDLFHMFLGVAIITTVLLIVIVVGKISRIIFDLKVLLICDTLRL